MYHEYDWSLNYNMPLDDWPVDIAQEALVLNGDTMGSPKGRQPPLQYEEEWRSLLKEGIDLCDLRKKALEGGLRAARFRSIAWKLLLGALTPGLPDTWLSQVESDRNHYLTLKSKLRVSPIGSAEPQSDNPLSQDEQSTWHQFFCDRDLQALIKQDVVRTFPGVDFFRGEHVQEIMINILFAYAREYPAMCYRQGMHEVLAPVVFVVHCDQQALLHTQEQSQVSSEIVTVLDPKYLEADSYTLFRRIMNAIEGSYLIPNMAPTSTGYFPANMKTTYLSRRWLRLLFGREFPLQDLLVLWDAIFADSSSFDLVNYIVVSMLVAIRSSLLKSDYTNCLTQLMRYPGSMDISIIIDYALYLKAPSKFSPPPKMVPPKVLVSTDEKNERAHYHRRKQVTLRRNQKAVSEETIGFTVPERVQSNQFSSSEIVDGFKTNDGLMNDLLNAYTVMSLCRLKLSQYHSVLEDAVPPNHIEAQQALTGIHELCSLLKVQKVVRVEKGTEANEVVQKKPERKPSVDMTVFKHITTPIKETSPT
nr:TBC1 domain family member 5 [Halyomorpha halys]